MGIKNRRQFKKALRSPKVEAVIMPIVREGKIDSLLGRIACFMTGRISRLLSGVKTAARRLSAYPVGRCSMLSETELSVMLIGKTEMSRKFFDKLEAENPD